MDSFYRLCEGMDCSFSKNCSDNIKKVFKRVCERVYCLVHGCYCYPEEHARTILCFSEDFQDFQIPDQNHVQNFLLYFMRQLQLEEEFCVICYIFLERLVSNAKIALLPHNWRRFVLISLLLAAYVREDKMIVLATPIIAPESMIVKACPHLILKNVVEMMENFLSVCSPAISPQQYVDCYHYLCSLEGIVSPSPPQKLLEVLEQWNLKCGTASSDIGEFQEKNEGENTDVGGSGNITPINNVTINATPTTPKAKCIPNMPATLRKDSVTNASINSDSQSAWSSVGSQSSRSPPDMVKISDRSESESSSSTKSVHPVNPTSAPRREYHIDSYSEENIRAAFMMPRSGGTVTSGSLGMRCSFNCMNGFETALWSFEIKKDVFRWTGQIKYNLNDHNIAPLLGLGATPKITAGNSSLSENGSCSFVFGMIDSVQGSGLRGVQNASKIAWKETPVPENSLVSVVVDAEERTLSFFVNANKVPLVVSGVSIPCQLGVTGKGQPSFTSISFCRVRGCSVSDATCKEFKI